MSASAFLVVGVVSSAGGLDAMTRVLGELPHDLDAAFLVVQHQDPTFPGHLAEILDRRCALTVREAVDGDDIEPGLVLTARPGRHLLVDSRLHVRLVRSGSYPPNRPSADLLLVTLAVALEDRAVALVLSGGGTDGATGATAIHDFGGTVIASSAESSAHFGMPQATIDRDDAIDHVAHVDAIAALLVSLVGAAPLGGPRATP